MRKLILLCFIPIWAFTQVNVDEINPFVEYTNESIHGMLIIHRMLENFNQQLNKFVDLESTQVNFYGNDDLPRNIFEDKEHLFYDITPYEWYSICEAIIVENEILEPLSGPLNKMKQITDNLNQLRFDLQSLINTLDLNESGNQKIVYKKLNKGVLLYDQFDQERDKFKEQIEKLTPIYSRDPLLKALANVHQNVEAGLDAFRYKNPENLITIVSDLKAAIRLIPVGGGNELKEIRAGSNGIVDDFEEFMTEAQIDPAYKQYGPFYYYHNVKTINKTNRYGNGIIFFINDIIKKKNGLLCLEVPHYFKVVYPVKEEVTPYLASSNNKIVRTPVELEKRLIITNEQKIIVDNHQVEFMVYDHKEQDGDVLSLNFNGDWILENHALSQKPLPLKLSLNSEGKNYLILHAVNTGSRPPNTMAISYFYKGKRQEIILNSDLENSEMIEIDIEGSDH